MGDSIDDGRRALVARMTAFPDVLTAAARAFVPHEAGLPAGEWTAREIVSHLVAVERRVWQTRLDMLTASTDEPAWTWTEPGPTDDPEAATLDGALVLLAAERAATLARVTALDDGGWARTGVHATYGRLDVAGLLGVLLDHDDQHLAGLRTIGT